MAGIIRLREPQQRHGRRAAAQHLVAEPLGRGGVAGLALGDREPVFGRQRPPAGGVAAGGVIDPAITVGVEEIGGTRRHVRERDGGFADAVEALCQGRHV